MTESVGALSGRAGLPTEGCSRRSLGERFSTDCGRGIADGFGCCADGNSIYAICDSEVTLSDALKTVGLGRFTDSKRADTGCLGEVAKCCGAFSICFRLPADGRCTWALCEAFAADCCGGWPVSGRFGANSRSIWSACGGGIDAAFKRGRFAGVGVTVRGRISKGW